MTEQTQVTTTSSDPGTVANPSTPPVVPDVAVSSTSTPVTDTQQQPVAKVRPEKLDERYWDAEKGEPKLDDLLKEHDELRAAKAKFDERAASIPKEATGYKLELAADVKLPDGFTLNENDPLFIHGRELALKSGFTQAEFSELASLVVNSQIQQQQAFAARMAAEKAKLGANADDRVKAVIDALTGALGEEAKPFMHMLVSAELVTGFEKLLSSSAAIGFSQTGRVEGAGNGLPENWASLSPVDRRAFKLAQKGRSK